ncbi:MAG: SCO family protein [Candidatus Thioglobus sp.]|nr:MAG: SCO family protein [Candidatus Thioglobus sp.]
MSIKTSIAIITLAIVLALFYVANSSKDYSPLSQQLKSSYINHNADKTLPEFALIDHNNRKFDNDSLKGKWSLLLFIYTHCPDVCPTELFSMARLKQLAAEDKELEMPAVVVITFDTARDTPEVMGQYVGNFDQDFIGVSGEQEQIDKLVKHFGAYYERVIYTKNGKQSTIKAGEKLPESALKDGYLINHTARIYLINPAGKTIASFPSPHKPTAILSDIKQIVQF